MKIELYVVSHKKAKMPDDEIYLPLQVGKNDSDFSGYLRDNSGDNIADKNNNYSELTAQYWVAHNRKADVKGLVHYRRLFSNGKHNFFKSVESKYNDILDTKTVTKLMQEYDMILPKKRNYYIESSWSHYEHIHNIKDMEYTESVIAEKFPDYLPFFKDIVNRKSAHMFNMLIAKDYIFDGYTDWLFSILSEVEKKTDISDYSDYERRIYGFISELLLDVWVEKNKINYTELPVMFMGNQHWVKKITSFLVRKVRGKSNE